MTRMLAGHENASRGSANGVSGIVLRESHSLTSKPVQVGGANELLPKAAEFAVAKVVGDNQDDVWLACIGRRRSTNRQKGNKNCEGQ